MENLSRARRGRESETRDRRRRNSNRPTLPSLAASHPVSLAQPLARARTHLPSRGPAKASTRERSLTVRESFSDLCPSFSMRSSAPVSSGMPTGHKYMGWWGDVSVPRSLCRRVAFLVRGLEPESRVADSTDSFRARDHGHDRWVDPSKRVSPPTVSLGSRSLASRPTRRN